SLCPTIVDPSAEAPNAQLQRPPGRAPRPTIPVSCVQRNACPLGALDPTTTMPSAETAWAMLMLSLCSAPRSTKPVFTVQRNAFLQPESYWSVPTMTSPSDETPLASASTTPFGSGSSRAMPPLEFQRNASDRPPGGDVLLPTIIEPEALA